MNEVLTNNIKNTSIGAVIALVLTGLSYIVADFFGWAELKDIDWLTAFAVFTSYICTWLCVHQTRWNYPIGVITTAAYSVVFWQAGFFALSIFNAYLVFSLAYGWWRWGKDEDTRPVTLINAWSYIGYGLFALGIYGLLWVINTSMGAEMQWYDVLLAIGSGVAQFMLDNKKIENWILWILVDIGSIASFIYTNQPIVAFQYVFFLLNAFYAFFVWKSTMGPWTDYYEEDLKELVFPEHARKPQQTAAFD